METDLEFYRSCVKRLLLNYKDQKAEWAKTELVFDDTRMRYLVLWVGWRKQKRIHNCLIHIDIVDQTVDQTIVIQVNNTEDLLDEELVEMGIPADKIYLGLIPPETHNFLRQQNQATTIQQELELA